MDKNSKKLFIIINEKRVFIHSLAQLKELQKQTFLKRVKLAILRALKLKQWETLQNIIKTIKIMI